MRQFLTLTLLVIAAALHAENALVWLDTDHNFGAFSEDLNKVRCTYRAVNTGSEPVAVISARANCGCTVPSYPREAIQPGDTLRIDVEYNAVGRPGGFSKKVFIDTSDGQKSVLKVRGTVVAAQNTLRSRYPVEVGAVHLSERIMPLGTTTKGHLLYGGINIYNSTDHPIRPRVHQLPDYMKAVIKPAYIPVGESAFLSLTAATDRVSDWGTVTDSFMLVPDAKAPQDSVTVDVVMIINEDFSKLTPEQLAQAPAARFSTESVDFERIKGNKPLTRTFTITNTGKSTLIIRRMDTAEKAITLNTSTKEIEPDKTATVTVTLDPAQLPADTPLNARVNFVLNVPGAPHAAVRAVGTH